MGSEPRQRQLQLHHVRFGALLSNPLLPRVFTSLGCTLECIALAMSLYSHFLVLRMYADPCVSECDLSLST
jgi:hypothetical protein